MRPFSVGASAFINENWPKIKKILSLKRIYVQKEIEEVKVSKIIVYALYSYFSSEMAPENII